MIPEMTSPLGRYWQQPADIRMAPMDDETVILTPAQFEGLADYSYSMPTGAYEGKCWRRQQWNLQTGEHVAWWLGWYGPCDRPGYVSNNWRKIEVVS